MNNLKKFIDTYLKIALNIYHYVENCIKEKKTGTEFAEFLETLMYYLTRINICLLFNYNDLIIESSLENNNNQINDKININEKDNSSENRQKQFNYYSHDISKKLLRILIITSTMYGIFTMNNENINKEHLKTLNILLETYILTNNVYSIHLKSVTAKSFNIYYTRMLKIKRLVNLTNLVKKKKLVHSKLKKNSINDEEYVINNYTEDNGLYEGDVDMLNKKKEEYFIVREIARPEGGENNIESCLRRVIFNVKEKIESSFERFFQYKIRIDKVMKELNDNLNSFCEDEQTILNTPINIEFPDDLKEEFNYNTFLRNKQIKKYKKKIKSLIKTKFVFFTYRSFNSSKVIQTLIDELILSSFDTTITKIFFMDKSNRLLSSRDCSTILNFLYIYALTEDGLRNFCLGRNFRRIIKCFALHPKLTLEFYYNIFKGIYLYNIDIRNHKKLSKIVVDLIDYLKKFEVINVESELMFKEFFYYISKILVYLSDSLDLKYLSAIKADLCQIL